MYIEADGGSYISDYLNTYSYGRSSPDLHPDEMVSFAVMRNGMTWGECQQGSYIEIPYGRNSPDLVSDIVSGCAFQVVSGGDVDSTNWNIVNSYGLSEYH